MTTLCLPSSPALACPPRFGTERDLSCDTRGPEVARFAEQLGTPLMPWQQQVVDVALELDPVTGRLKYRRVILTVPRQSGKTTLLLSLFLHRALGFSGRPQVMSYAAQTGVDARKKFVDEHVPTLTHSIFEPLFKPRMTNGHEAVLWKNGSRHHISAGTEKSGHGATLDLAVIDEAFAQPDGRLEQAFSPAMVTRPQAQLWFVSTAGTPSNDWFRQKVEAGRLGAPGLAFFEWSAPDKADPHDPAVWRSCMPALGLTVDESVIAAEAGSMPEDEFRRAYLNQWVEKGSETVIDPNLWASLIDGQSQPVGAVTFAVDVTPDRQRATIAVAGRRTDGLAHIEVIENEPGTAWVPDALSRLSRASRTGPIVLDPGGPAGALIPAIESAGLQVQLVGGREMAQACGAFYDTVTNKQLRHLGDRRVAAALGAARRRPLIDGAWAWHRKDTSTDLSPLVALTLALQGLAAPAKGGLTRVRGRTAHY